MKDYGPQCIAVVFDAPGKTFRDALFAEYKAHRPPMPNDLRSQVEPLLEILRAQGLPVLRVDGVEADDVIGTLACSAAREGKQVLISTGDKDMAQLVGDSITLINTMSNTVLDRTGVKTKFDVFPEQMVDYLALVGDPSDNIPGIEKVGPKTAARLLAQYGTLDGLIAHVAEIDGKVGENLRNGITTLELSRKLATISTGLDLSANEVELTPHPPDVERLRQLYTRYELKSLLRQLEGNGGADAVPAAERTCGRVLSPPPPTLKPLNDEALTAPPSPYASVERRYETIFEWPQFEAWLEKLRAAELFAFDTETTDVDYMKAEIVGVSFCIEPGVAAYVPVKHDYAGAPDQLDRDRVLSALKPILEDPQRAKVGQHLKYDAHVLRRHGIQLAGMRFDTMLESYVWNSVATRHDLDTTAARYLGITTIKFEDVAGKGARQLSFNEVPVDRAAEYSAEDADVTMRLHRTLWPMLEGVPTLA